MGKESPVPSVFGVDIALFPFSSYFHTIQRALSLPHSPTRVPRRWSAFSPVLSNPTSPSRPQHPAMEHANASEWDLHRQRQQPALVGDDSQWQIVTKPDKGKRRQEVANTRHDQRTQTKPTGGQHRGRGSKRAR